MDTIAAIATPQAAGGIGIIRISGPEAVEVAQRVFRCQSGRPLTQARGYTARYGRIHTRTGEEIDEAVALVFRAPKSYTGENVVELSCHGGLVLLQRTLRAVLEAGARMAQAGEFTKRAFLNGKLDLTQAEAVMGLIGAQGTQAARAALTARDGALSGVIRETTRALTHCAAHMAAWADYPEEEIPQLEDQALEQTLQDAADALDGLLGRFDAGQAVTQGVDTVIAGRPNVGKSTLMNFLSGSERSIVTEVAGTTRDVVEETVRLGGVLLRLADTAGLRETRDAVERIGVERARSRAKRAGLILAVFDASAPLDEEDRRLLALCKGRPSVAVLNKTDLPPVLTAAELKAFGVPVVSVSAARGSGYDALCRCVERVLGAQGFDPAAPMLATERQRDCCRRAAGSLAQALAALREGMTLDAVGVCVDDVLAALMELTGERATDAVVNAVFAQFCVGK